MARMRRVGSAGTIKIRKEEMPEEEEARLGLHIAKLALEVRLNFSPVESLTLIVKSLLAYMEPEERQKFLKEIGQHEKGTEPDHDKSAGIYSTH